MLSPLDLHIPTSTTPIRCHQRHTLNILPTALIYHPCRLTTVHMSMGILSRLALKPNTLTSSEAIRYPTVYSSTTSIKYVESLRCMSVDAILRSTRNSNLKAPFYLYQRIQLLNFYLAASIYQRRRLTTVYVRHWRTWPPEITKKDIVQDWDGLSTRISMKLDFRFLPYSLELPTTSTDHGVCPRWRAWPLNSPRWKWNRIGMMV